MAALPYPDLANGQPADATQLLANFNFLLGLILGISSGFTLVSALPETGSVGETVLLEDGTAPGTPYYYGRDDAWHAFFLAS